MSPNSEKTWRQIPKDSTFSNDSRFRGNDKGKILSIEIHSSNCVLRLNLRSQQEGLLQKVQDHDSFESILKEREIHLDLEAIQRQLDIAKREYSQSKFTLRYSGNIVRLECAYCPNINIQMELKDSRNVAGIVKRHQTSKYHTDNRYHEAQRKKGNEQSENNI
ncbi:uncharacterized protein EAF02_003316 [Botrytis sinoallii]|uniref:uncharacterized protein n=1 Tax=Botrytis sinoallii TaxID=1463999 RepID=UPI0018FF2FDF|nr:uncharacterized protein EAF02_003316 [Botrytis sinoallii]KAF7886669.1 hypothetical protein EAF02_003316 [Botrytis sinoallii]